MALRARLSGTFRPSETSLPDAVLSVEPRLSLHRDVISYPLQPGRDREFRGGLVDCHSGELIEAAVHVSGHASRQEDPADGPPAQIGAGLPEFRVPVLYGGILHNDFGHFMLESLGRLWAYDRVRHLDPYIAFHPVWGTLDYLDKRGFAYQVFKGFKIPRERILLLNRPVRLKRVVVPEMLYGYDQCLNPTPVIVDFMRRFEFRRSTPRDLIGATRVYVSRSGLPGKNGRPMGEKLFEDYLRRQGYTIFHPQRHSLNEQLTVYSNADRIIFCDGAALHSCVLLPDLRARVAVISRRQDSRWDGSEIVNQFRGYGQDVAWIDAVRFQYQFGLETWDARSFVDWHDVSSSLKDDGFTDDTFDEIRAVDVSELVAAEVHDYVSAISSDPRFTRYLMGLKE